MQQRSREGGRQFPIFNEQQRCWQEGKDPFLLFLSSVVMLPETEPTFLAVDWFLPLKLKIKVGC